MNNAREKFSYQKSLSVLFASFTVLCLGALSLLNNFSIDLYSVLFMFSIVLPASLSMAFMGFVIGRIFDSRGNIKAAITSSSAAKSSDNPYKIKSMFQEQATDTLFDEDETGE